MPEPGPDDLLVRVHAAALNRSDWENLLGRPFYARMQSPVRPNTSILGSDLAGEVVTTGPNVQQFKVGDRIMADTMYHGAAAFAEYALVRQGAPVSHVPDGLTCSQAAALPQAGTIALHALVGLLQAARVLLMGGGGATGIFFLQLARAAGATITAVDSGSKLQFMHDLGAHRVIDYRTTDLTDLSDRFDLILDPIAALNASAARRLLADEGTYLVVGGSTRRLLSTLIAGLRSDAGHRQLKVLMVKPGSEHLQELARQAADGSLLVPVEAEYALADLPLALQRLGDGLAQGRLVIKQHDLTR